MKIPFLQKTAASYYQPKLWGKVVGSGYQRASGISPQAKSTISQTNDAD
jgi:hypothetical protein